MTGLLSLSLVDDNIVWKQNFCPVKTLYAQADLEYPVPVFDCADVGSVGVLVLTTELV